ncbi:hypothetical protein [Lacrimispora brassicae]
MSPLHGCSNFFIIQVLTVISNAIINKTDKFIDKEYTAMRQPSGIWENQFNLPDDGTVIGQMNEWSMP